MHASPDLILHNGRIMTLDPSRGEVSAIAPENGTIVTHGTGEEIPRLATVQTSTVDLRGKRANPALVDDADRKPEVRTAVARGEINTTKEAP